VCRQSLALAGGWLGALNIWCLTFIPQCRSLRADALERGCISSLMHADVPAASAATTVKLLGRLYLALGVCATARSLILCNGIFHGWGTDDWDVPVASM
jgi:hypothetical protein